MSREDDKNLHSEALDYTGANLKTTWGNGQETVDGPDTQIVRPNKRQLEQFSSIRPRTCGDCKHFSKQAFMSEAKRTRFMRELVLGYEWKPEHLCDRPENLGLCTERTGTVVGPMSAACDAHKRA